MNEFFSLMDSVFLNSIFRFVTPILLAALGGAVCSKVGIVNINLEGQMLMGSFGAVLGSYFFGGTIGGVLVAMLLSISISLIFAVLLVEFNAGEIIVGLALNLFCSALSIFLLRTIFNVTGTFSSPELQGLEILTVPVISRLPVIGPLVSGHTSLVYLSWLIVLVLYIFLYFTSSGLRMRGVGEHPEASITLGVRVNRVYYIAIITCGALCGLAGAQLSLGNVTMFVQNMSGGRGWIAIVANMLGQSHPLGVFSSSVLFGFVSSLSFRIQGLGWPQEFTEMLPFVITIISLVLVYMLSEKRVRRPRVVAGQELN